MANWKAKNLKAGQQMVKDAAKLYAKWDLVNPYTGRSSPNLVVPHDTSDGFATTADGEAAARTPRMKLYKNGPMLTDAHLMMLKEVTADNGRTYVLPWWCVVVHPEANGDGQPTGLSDGYGRPYPQGKGWDGAKTPMGASGIPGVDCTHPGGQTLVPYDKDWPLWKGPRVPIAEAEPISNEEAAELEEEPAAEEEAPAEEAAPVEEEPAAAEGGAPAEGGEDAAEGGAAQERDVARQEMLSSEWPASDFPPVQWRHGINIDNALNKPVSPPQAACMHAHSHAHPPRQIHTRSFTAASHKLRACVLPARNRLHDSPSLREPRRTCFQVCAQTKGL